MTLFDTDLLCTYLYAKKSNTSPKEVSLCVNFRFQHTPSFLDQSPISITPVKSNLKNSKQSSINGIIVKRRVSFADSYGFQLTQIKFIEVQKDNGLCSPAITQQNQCFIPYFTLPSLVIGNHRMSPDILLRNKNICFEFINANSSTKLSGTILVKGTSKEKRVFGRWTINYWMTYSDIDAVFSTSTEEDAEKFRFTLNLPSELQGGTELNLAFCCEMTDGIQIWDNNNGCNYGFRLSDQG